MKPYSSDLMALLQSGVPLYKVHLFMIGPCQNGAMMYATDGTAPITFNGNTYQPTQFGSWKRGAITVKIGLDSNSTQLTVFADNNIPVYFPGTSNSALLLDGIKYGLLGRAPVTIYCAYMTTYGVLTGQQLGGSLVETKFVGMMTSVSYLGLTKAVVDVQDMLYLLNIQIPDRLIQPSCAHTLYDVGCTLVAASFTVTGAVASISYPYQFVTTAHLSPVTPAGVFSQGSLTWTSGKNNGLTNFVRTWTPGGSNDTFILDVQPIFPIQVGDTFKVTQGCNKTLTACLDLQGSSANAYKNFGGQPNVPVPETAI